MASRHSCMLCSVDGCGWYENGAAAARVQCLRSECQGHRIFSLRERKIVGIRVAVIRPARLPWFQPDFLYIATLGYVSPKCPAGPAPLRPVLTWYGHIPPPPALGSGPPVTIPSRISKIQCASGMRRRTAYSVLHICRTCVTTCHFK